MELDDDIIAAAVTAAAELTELALEDGDTSPDSIEATFRDLYGRILHTVMEVTPAEEEDEEDEEEDAE
jgi:hypothetical protein